jgi:hypothetical protein
VTARLTKLKIAILRSEEPHWRIAQSCDIDPSLLSRYATGERPLPRKALLSLARHFGCEPEDLDGWAEIDFEKDPVDK